MSEINFIDKSADEVLREILAGLENGVKEPLYPGDERRIFGEALALVFVAMYETVNDAARQKFLRYARGEVLDALAENYDISRIGAVPATCSVRFTLNAAVGSDVTIPEGTRVTGDFERYFAVDTTVVIPAGDTDVTVGVTATEGGESYNAIPAGEINVLVDLLPYIDVVENTTATAGGADGESDDALRERIRAASDRSTTAGSAASYRYWAMQADPRIIDAQVITAESTIRTTAKKKVLELKNPLPLSTSDRCIVLTSETPSVRIETTGGVAGQAGRDYIFYSEPDLDYNVYDVIIILRENGSLYNESELKVEYETRISNGVRIIPVLEDGEIPDQTLLDKVLAAVSAENVRPMTDVVTVAAPEQVSYDIEIEYFVAAADVSSVVNAIEGEGGAIDQYIEWQRGALDRDINPDKLRQLVLNAGADRVNVVAPVYTQLDSNEVARFSGDKTVTHNVEG